MLTVIFGKKTWLQCGQDRIPDTKIKVRRKKVYSECSYLPQTNECPTSHSVVAEILKRSLKTADKANRHSINVTCNLAIAKIALQV